MKAGPVHPAMPPEKAPVAADALQYPLKNGKFFSFDQRDLANIGYGAVLRDFTPGLDAPQFQPS